MLGLASSYLFFILIGSLIYPLSRKNNILITKLKIWNFVLFSLLLIFVLLIIVLISEWILTELSLFVIQIKLAYIIYFEIRINWPILVLYHILILVIFNLAYVKLFSFLIYNLIAQFINFWFWFFYHLYFIFLFFSHCFTYSFGSPHLLKVI